MPVGGRRATSASRREKLEVLHIKKKKSKMQGKCNGKEPIRIDISFARTNVIAFRNNNRREQLLFPELEKRLLSIKKISSNSLRKA